MAVGDLGGAGGAAQPALERSSARQPVPRGETSRALHDLHSTQIRSSFRLEPASGGWPVVVPAAAGDGPLWNQDAGLADDSCRTKSASPYIRSGHAGPGTKIPHAEA